MNVNILNLVWAVLIGLFLGWGLCLFYLKADITDDTGYKHIIDLEVTNEILQKEYERLQVERETIVIKIKDLDNEYEKINTNSDTTSLQSDLLFLSK